MNKTLLKYLCRAHMEISGGYSGFAYQKELEEAAQKIGMPAIDFFYFSVGYAHDEKMSAEVRAKIRKMAAANKASLKKFFNTQSASKITTLLAEYGCTPFNAGKVEINDSIKAIEQEVRLVAEYFLHSPDALVRSDKEITIGDMIRSKKGAFPNKKAYNEYSNSDVRIATIKSRLPDVSIDQGYGIPFIYMDTLYTKNDIFSSVNAEAFTEAVMNQCYLCNLDIPEKAYFRMSQDFLRYQSSENDRYLEYVDIANHLGIKVKELLERFGLCYVNQLKNFEETGCVMYKSGAFNLDIYTSSQGEDEAFITIPEESLLQFYNEGTLKTLRLDKGKPVISGNKTLEGSGVQMSLFR